MSDVITSDRAQASASIGGTSSGSRSRPPFAAGVTADAAVAQEKMKVAAIFSTPIEEPWVNQVHEALLKARGGARHRIQMGRERRPRPTMRACCANSPATATR